MVAIALLAAVALALVSSFVLRYRTIGPIDELQHIDYAAKASSGHLVAVGERVGQLGMREQACRGIDAPIVLPPCESARFRPEQFQEEGFNTAAAHPPLYYAVTGVVARALTVLPGIDGFVLGARLTGALWLFLGLATTWVLGREVGADRLSLIAVCVGLASTPLILYSAGTVNNDATSLFVGATTMLATLRFLRGGLGWWWLAAVGGLAMAMKATNIVVLGAAALLLVSAALVEARSDGAERRRLLVGTGALFGGAVVVSVLWSVITALIARMPADQVPMSRRFAVDELSIERVWENVLAGLPPTQGSYWPVQLGGSLVVAWIGLVGLGIVVGPAAASLGAAADPRVRRMSGWVLAAMLAVGPVFVIVNYVQFGAYVTIPARYGISLVPAAVVSLACCTRTRVAHAVLVAGVAFGIVAAAVGLA